VQFWKDIEKAFIYTAKYKQALRDASWPAVRLGPDCDVILTLPCGRELHYHKSRSCRRYRREDRSLERDQEHHWEHVWGGHLTENVVQAMSRDILMEACVALEAAAPHRSPRTRRNRARGAGGVGGDVLKLAIVEMARRPAWAPDLSARRRGCVVQADT
jgi:hypothetical protein